MIDNWIVLFIYGAFGLGCAALANQRGRSFVAWFFIGCLFTIFGLLLLFVLPDLKQEQRRLQRIVRENRRLREIVKSDRMSADQRFSHVEKRLDVHDQSLGLDTKPIAAVGGGSLPESSLPPPLLPSRVPKGLPEEGWFYAKGEERVGPMRWKAILEASRRGEISTETLVWCPAFEEWTRASEVHGLLGEAASS